MAEYSRGPQGPCGLKSGMSRSSSPPQWVAAGTVLYDRQSPGSCPAIRCPRRGPQGPCGLKYFRDLGTAVIQVVAARKGRVD